MEERKTAPESLSRRWRIGVLLVLIAGFTILIYLAVRSYHEAAPIPERVVDGAGQEVFTKADILGGQQVFLKYGLMENGTVWGHGGYLGPDYSAQYLHQLSLDTRERLAQIKHSSSFAALYAADQRAISDELREMFKQNRYDARTKTLTFTDAEVTSFEGQIGKWADHFRDPQHSAGLSATYIADGGELRQLTAFFAWTAWASAAKRPGFGYSYTNNFPYDPSVGNVPTTDAFLWSALSLIPLLAATAGALFAFGRFNFLGWKGTGEHVHPTLLPGAATPSQMATLKYFVVVALLFLAQTLVGGATAHFRADPGTFFGIDLSGVFPSNILRTWHLQLAIFWIATAYVAGGLFLAPAIGGAEPKGQAKGVHWLFAAIVIVAVGSLAGEWLGIKQILSQVWFWFGHQGWEYLDLGRAWQILLAAGLVIWLILVFRGIRPARRKPDEREISSLFLYAAVAIPLFYLPAMFFNSTTHYSIVDTWRFWIIHLWVEGFFELFVTVMVASIFYKLGMVTRVTAARVVYLDAILYLGAGIIGTGHHWYWTGQGNVTMALAACFSAMETVPLTLLTLDAWDFVKLSRGVCEICGKQIILPHRWTFNFLIAVGFWNFVGAGIFGFLINLPIVSYFEVGTVLTPNHGHAAMMGVFGMLGMALMVFACRQVLTDEQWLRVEKYFRVSFWGVNIGLAAMVVSNLFPGGVVQLWDVLKNGYWHARSPEFTSQGIMHLIEWFRLPGDAVFILFGALPAVIGSFLTYRMMRQAHSQLQVTNS